MGANNDEEKRPLMRKDNKWNKDAKFEYYGPPANELEDSGARDENFFESICLCICPAISWKQFIVIISLIEFAIFIGTIIPGLNNEAFLAPDP